MTNPLIRKLENGAKLTEEDKASLLSACGNVREVDARRQVIGEGAAPRNVHLVLEGYACRYKILPDGKRQIIAFFLPGDLCDLHVHILGWMDHSIGTLTRCRIAELSPETIDRLTANPRINRALWWSTLTDEGTLREWLVSMGQRPADQQLAHLFCELFFRLDMVGLTRGNSFDLPATQEEFGDATGLTPVHVNRMIRHLREQGLIEIDGRRLTIPDLGTLIEYSDFTPNYLHMGDRGQPGS